MVLVLVLYMKVMKRNEKTQKSGYQDPFILEKRSIHAYIRHLGQLQRRIGSRLKGPLKGNERNPSLHICEIENEPTFRQNGAQPHGRMLFRSGLKFDRSKIIEQCSSPRSPQSDLPRRKRVLASGPEEEIRSSAARTVMPFTAPNLPFYVKRPHHCSHSHAGQRLKPGDIMLRSERLSDEAGSDASQRCRDWGAGDQKMAVMDGLGLVHVQK